MSFSRVPTLKCLDLVSLGFFLPIALGSDTKIGVCGQKSNDSRVIGWMVTGTVLDVITDILSALAQEISCLSSFNYFAS